jgi:GNAT superfamily N-acetyltransferase
VASELVVRAARAGEAKDLTALCVRAKAHWGYDAEFMRLSLPSLTVGEDDILSGRVLVAERERLVFGMAKVAADGELDMMFVDPRVMGRGVGRALFDASVALARRFGRGEWRSSPIPMPRRSTNAWAPASSAMRRPTPFQAAPCPSMSTISRRPRSRARPEQRPLSL